MKIMKSNTQQGGFTLVEVLVATVIMAVGLLGIVTMHGNAMYFTKDSESQWVASDNVFRIFDTMRVRLKPRLNNNLNNRSASALAAMQNYAFAGPGGINGACPAVIANEQDELRCIQRDLALALPGGRIERIVINGTVEAGMTVQISWLATFQGTDAEAAAECAALAQAATGESYSDASINSGISADANADCSQAASGSVRKVASWVMVP